MQVQLLQSLTGVDSVKYVISKFAVTKYISQEGMMMHMKSTNQYITEGRHELAPATECQ